MIDIRDLTYTYPGEKQPALREMNLHVPEGQFLAVVGANGAGKSTLCYALAGFMPHFYHGVLQGSLNVAGRDAVQTPPGELAGTVGLVFQNPFNQITGARFTVREEVAFGLENLGLPREEIVERTEAILQLTGLSELAERSPFSLSGGQQQRLAIASVIVMRPRLLVLDEPTSQLDPAGTREVFTTLRALSSAGQTTVVLAEHKLEWVAVYADRVIALADGRQVADGPPRSVLASPEMADHGIGYTRYTQAAYRATELHLVPADGMPPVTLEQAVDFFSRSRGA